MLTFHRPITRRRVIAVGVHVRWKRLRVCRRAADLLGFTRNNNDDDNHHLQGPQKKRNHPVSSSSLYHQQGAELYKIRTAARKRGGRFWWWSSRRLDSVMSREEKIPGEIQLMITRGQQRDFLLLCLLGQSFKDAVRVSCFRLRIWWPENFAPVIATFSTVTHTHTLANTPSPSVLSPTPPPAPTPPPPSRCIFLENV